MAYVVKFTEDQMKTLDVFLGRVNLNAKEVGAFNDLTQVFSKAQKIEETPRAEEALSEE